MWRKCPAAGTFPIAKVLGNCSPSSNLALVVHVVVAPQGPVPPHGSADRSAWSGQSAHRGRLAEVATVCARSTFEPCRGASCERLNVISSSNMSRSRPTTRDGAGDYFRWKLCCWEAFENEPRRRRWKHESEVQMNARPRPTQ